MPDDADEENRPAMRFLVALVLALGMLALSCLLLLVPIAGPLLLVTFAPFMACNFAVKRSGLYAPRGWLWLGISAGAIMGVVEGGAVLFVFGLFGTVDPFEPVGLGLLVLLFSSNVVFSVLGARRGAAEGR